MYSFDSFNLRKISDCRSFSHSVEYLFSSLNIDRKPFDRREFIQNEEKVKFYTGLPEYRNLCPRQGNTKYLWIQQEANSPAQSPSLGITSDQFKLPLFSVNIDLWLANPAALRIQISGKNSQPRYFSGTLFLSLLNPFYLQE